MDVAFISGMGAFVSSMLIFVGSGFLLLMLIVGARLAYLITASTTLAFLLIMGVVWSINPLGPVGELPEWTPTDAAEEASAVEFGPAGAYPDGGGWAPPAEDDQAQLTQASELETSAVDYAAAQVEEGNLSEDLEDAVVVAESTRLLEQDGVLYGATTVGVEETGAEAVVVAEYDPGNPLGPARAITIGVLILLIVHLVLLSRAERRHERRHQEATA